MSLYAHADQVMHYNWYYKIIHDIDDFITMELTSPEGGFYSSLNADTEEGEGDYYTWTYDEFVKCFPVQADREFFTEYYNITKSGNWENGRNILYSSMDLFHFSSKKNMTGQQTLDKLDEGKMKLREARKKKTKPSVDTKILTSWNAMMLIGYLDAYVATGNEEFLTKAMKNAQFLKTNMMTADGHLWRNYKDGKTSIDGFLDDYAWLAKAYMRLYQVTFDKEWLMHADKIVSYALANFYDSGSGLFYYTAANSSGLVVRKMEITDNVIPSSNATMAELLHKLGTCLENKNYLDKCTQMWYKMAGKMYPMTSYYAHWCYLAGLLSYGTSEVAIMGKDAIKKNTELQKYYLPDCLFMGSTDKEDLPLLEKKLPDAQTLIYVCTNKECKFPVDDVMKAKAQIAENKTNR
jgi:uncharacterized protein YyaL (SSP411 family)